jgi:hypothetical protein
LRSWTPIFRPHPEPAGLVAAPLRESALLRAFYRQIRAGPAIPIVSAERRRIANQLNR